MGRNKDGKEFFIEVGLSLVEIGDGPLVMSFITDVTQLTLTEERYRSLFEDAPVMYAVTRNQAGSPIILDCNRAFLETLGYTASELIGQPLLG